MTATEPTVTPTVWRKRPIEVQAVQWTGLNVDELAAFATDGFRPIDPEDRGDDPVKTAQVFDWLQVAWVALADGDWVVRGVRGEFCPCADDELRETYDQVNPDELAPLADRQWYAMHDHDRCSSVPGWDPMSGPYFLCDCDALPAEWHRRVEAQKAERST